MALNESSNLLRKFDRMKETILLIFLFFSIAVSSAHYHHEPCAAYRHHNSIHEAPDIYSIQHVDSPSVQSLQNIFSITKPAAKPFDSPTQPFVHKTPSTSALSTVIYKSPTTYASLCQIDNLSNHRRSSLLKHLSQEAGINHFPSDHAIPTSVSTLIPTIAKDNPPIEKRQPIEVRVRCIFLRVGEIDTLNERYTSEIFFEASWYSADPKIGGKYEPQAGHFNPQLLVMNNIGDTLRHDVRQLSKNLYRSNRIAHCSI